MLDTGSQVIIYHRNEPVAGTIIDITFNGYMVCVDHTGEYIIANPHEILPC